MKHETIITVVAVVCWLGIAVSTVARAETTYGDVSVGLIDRVYDGDTFFASIAGWPSIAGRAVGVRVNGVDTPELRRAKCSSEKKKGLEAKAFLHERITEATTVELRNMKRGKYFRIVADVYLDNVNVADQLIKAGLAYKYYGGKKKGWCN